MSAASAARSRPARRLALLAFRLLVRGTAAVLRWSARLLVLAAILLVLLLVHLHVAGLPPYVSARVTALLAERGIHLQFSRLLFRLGHGLVAENVQFFERPEDAQPILAADSVCLVADPVALLRRHRLVPIFSIDGATLVLDTRADDAPLGEASGTILVQGLSATVTLQGPALYLRDFAADCFGIRFEGRGAFYLPPPGGGEEAEKAPADPLDDSPRVFDLPAILAPLRHLPPAASQAIERLNALRFNAPPRLRFAFAAYAAHPEANAATVDFACPAGGIVYDLPLDSFHASLAWRDQTLSVRDFQFAGGSGTFRLAATYDIPGERVAAHLLSTLPVSFALPLVPPAPLALLRNEMSNLDAPLRIEFSLPETTIPRLTAAVQALLASDLFAPPPPADADPFASVALRPANDPAPDSDADAPSADPLIGFPPVELSLSVRDTALHGFPVDSFDADLRLEGDRLSVERAEVFGGEKDRTRVQVSSASFDFATLRYEAFASATGEAADARHFLTDSQNEYLAWFETVDPVSTTNLSISGTVGTFDVKLDLDAHVDTLAVNGFPFDSVECHLTLADEALTLSSVRAVRPEGRLLGLTRIAFNPQTVFFDLDSTLDPRVTFDMLGPDVSNFMSRFTVDGPAAIRALGTLDYCNFSLNDLRIHADASHGSFGYSTWLADSASFDLALQGMRLHFTNIAARAFGGAIAADAALYPVNTPDRWHFAVQAAATNLQFAEVLDAATAYAATLRDPDGTAGSGEAPAATNAAPAKLTGKASGNIRIAGYIGEGEQHTIDAVGDVAIRNGRLFQLSLFDGLSALISHLVPDFSFFAQTDATASFRIADATVHVPDAFIGGSLFSVKGAGTCDFDGNLDFRIDLRLLRRGFFSSILRILTLPVTRLFQYTVDGTLDAPTWHATNFDPSKILKNPASIVNALNPIAIINDSAKIITATDTAPVRRPPPSDDVPRPVLPDTDTDETQPPTPDTAP